MTDYVGRKNDGATVSLQPMVDCWRKTDNLNEEETARSIHEDQIDSLLDLAGHTQGKMTGKGREVLKISACIIARNEEENISKCIESLKASVDEIIVVDTGSTDRTAQIAENLGCCTVAFTWADDFAAAKNFALSRAAGDWIVFLDADEYFSEATRGNLRRVIERQNQTHTAIQVKLVNIDSDHGDREIDYFYKIRIFARTDAHVYQGKIHETLMGVAEARLCRVEEKELLIYHTGYSARSKEAKCRRNLQALQSGAGDGQDQSQHYAGLADAYYGLREYENAVQSAEKSILCGNVDLTYRSRMYRILIYALQELERPDKQKEWIERAIQAFPDLPDFFFERAYISFFEGDYDAALADAMQALELHETYHGRETSLFGAKLAASYEMIARILDAKKEPELAAHFYQQLLLLDPYQPTYFESFYRILCQWPEAAAIQALRKIYAEDSQRDLEFLVEQMGQISRNRVFVFYAQAKKRLLGEETLPPEVLLAAGNAQAVIEAVKKQAAEKMQFATAALLLSTKTEELRQAATELPEVYQHLILKYASAYSEALSAQEIAIYEAVLLLLIKAAKQETILNFARIAQEFPAAQGLKIADQLQEYQCYEAALLLYEACRGKGEDTAALYRNLGCCYYGLHRDGEAAVHFQKAAELEPTHKAAENYLRWIQSESE